LRYSRISGTGRYLPQKVLTNADLERMVDTDDQWIRERTGISERRIVVPGETTCDLAEKASRNAIEAAGISTADIDLIVLATTTPNKVFPSTACLLQKRLDIHGCPAFDIQAVCTGFVYALDVADKYVRCGASSCALVIGAETFSRIIDWADRDTCVLFGDGAGAVILRADEQPGIRSSHIHADGTYESLLYVDAGISEGYPEGRNGEAYTRMSGNKVFRTAVRTLERVIDETIQHNGMHKSDVDWLIPHQANTRILEATARMLGVDMEKVVVTVGEHGNTSAASVPMALDVAVRDGRIKRGDTLLMAAFGGGFTWGTALVEY